MGVRLGLYCWEIAISLTIKVKNPAYSQIQDRDDGKLDRASK
jgi:hypothetical protein